MNKVITEANRIYLQVGAVSPIWHFHEAQSKSEAFDECNYRYFKANFLYFFMVFSVWTKMNCSQNVAQETFTKDK